MTAPPSSPAPLAFGPFEVDARVGELRKGGVRVRLSGQPLQILLLLLRKPGDLVTREELREQVWSEGTFVDFEHGLNAAINKLRRALGDSADHPRYIETVTGRGYRFIGTVRRDADAVSVHGHLPVTAESAVAPRRQARWWPVAAAATCVATGLLYASHIYRPPARQPPWILTRLTGASGISDDPALSPDGRLLAYSSDQHAAGAGEPLPGGLDLYIKHVAGGAPIRLTFDGAGNSMPDFSPDGSRIVFRSSRNGGGIYEMPALGGDVRLVARDGLSPRVSPDGTQVAYWIGPPGVADSVPGSGAVWVVPLAGGQPRRVGPEFRTARYPIWHKDGKHLLMLGYTSSKPFDSSGIDWWVVATDGSSSVRTGAHETLVQAGLTQRNPRIPVRGVPEPRCWSRSSDNVTFSIPAGDSWNVWEIAVSARTGKVTGEPQRLTIGAGNDLRASCASGGALTFAKIDARSDVWLLPVELNHGRSAGAPQRMARGQPWHENPSLAQNGQVAFVSDQSGRMNVWIRELATGKELSVAASPFVQRYPVSSASGGRIAFSAYEHDKRVVYVSVPGGAPDRVCEGCLRATDWSGDEKTLLVFGGAPYQVDMLDIGSHRRKALVKHPAYDLLYGRYSPDQKWVSFTARVQPALGRIVVAPADGPTPVDESAWRTIAEVGPEDYANWSPDGQTLYFSSGRDGYSCLWGQRVDASSMMPRGEAFALHHFHGRLSFKHGGWSAAAGRIAIPLVETTGNVWMMSRSGEP